jgi:hypothetical protein
MYAVAVTYIIFKFSWHCLHVLQKVDITGKFFRTIELGVKGYNKLVC